MLTLTVAFLVSQAPQCLTAGNKRVCGFDCKESGVAGACAQTAAGACDKGPSGQVLCFDPPVWVSKIYGSKTPKPECVWRGQRGACGYHCKAQGDAVQCAKTPAGVCTARYDQVTCFDPPVEVFGVFGDAVPEPECVAKEGLLACGYHCKLGGNASLKCSSTPFGVCDERGGAVSCFDPDKFVVCAMGQSTPSPTCVNAGSAQLVCGYHCAQAGPEVACAKTPGGTCDTSGSGKPVCFDPPVRGGSDGCVSLIASP